MSSIDVLTALAHQLAATPLQFLGFWLSVSLPVFYLPFILRGLDGTLLPAFVGLLVLHVGALLLGHGYRQEG